MPTWNDAIVIARTLPGVEVSTWYATPGLKVAGKGFARLRTEAEGGLVLMCSLDEKARLLESGEPYYTTPHYDGYGSIIVDLEHVDREALRELVEQAWRMKAPAKLRALRDPWTIDKPPRRSPARRSARKRTQSKTRR
jgi:hypothetical protein